MAALVLFDQALIHERTQRRICPMRVLFKYGALQGLSRNLPARDIVVGLPLRKFIIAISS